MATYALPSAVAAPSLGPRSRSSQYLSPDSTPRLGDYDGSTNGSLTPKGSQANASSPSLSLDTFSRSSTSPKPSNSHARSSSYLPGLVDKFRSNSSDDMRKGRPRGESDLGRPALPTRSATAYQLPRSPASEDVRSSNNLPAELLTSILIPLPFLLSSLSSPLNITSRHTHHSKVDAAEEVLEDVASSAIPVPDSLIGLTQTCALAAGTLLLVGIWGLMNQKPTSKRRRSSVGPSKEQGTRSKSSTKQSIRRIFLRMAAVALPYLATIEIGGVRTGIVLLAAVGSGMIGSESRSADHSWASSVKRAVSSHKWTCAVYGLSLVYDLVWHMPGTEYSSTFRGYLALAKSVLLLAPPLPTYSSASFLNASKPSSAYSTSAVPATPISPIQGPTNSSFRIKRSSYVSALVATNDDTTLTLIAGAILGVMAFLLTFVAPVAKYSSSSMLVLYLLSITSAAGLFLFSRPDTLRKGGNLGLGLGLLACQFFAFQFEYTSATAAFALLGISACAFGATQLDTKLDHGSHSKKSHAHSHIHGHGHSHGHTHDHSEKQCSAFTKFLLAQTEDKPLFHDILDDKESRRIVYFMFINLGFMFVQTFYALVSGSLGLLSDSIHMFFDCMGLLAGLIASIMSKWPPNATFPYGYGKVETLSGLGNGIFLVIISIEIIWESFERFMEGAELKRLNELMLVSTAGLGVNLIGLLFIGHAHHHGHDHGHDHGHGHSHGHDHSHVNGHAHSHEKKHDHDNMMQQVVNKDAHGHSHGHSNENMMGIYLHILADTMGSVAVIASTILTAYTGWMGWDPIASCVIAILIIAASYPLVVGSARRLLLTVPHEVEYQLRDTLQEISNIRGVTGYAVPRFWMEDGEADSHAHDHHGHGQGHEHQHGHDHSHHAHLHGHDHEHDHDHDHKHQHHHHHDHGEHKEPGGQKILGVIHIIAQRGADPEDVRKRTDDFLRERNMHVVIQVDKEGQGRCWCGGDKSLHQRTSSIVPGLG